MERRSLIIDNEDSKKVFNIKKKNNRNLHYNSLLWKFVNGSLTPLLFNSKLE